jgi:hypothetical protein
MRDVLLAAGLLRDQIAGAVADARGFSYQSIPHTTDPLFLPGALKYGGLGGLAALAAPTELELFGTEGLPPEEFAPLAAAYKASGGTFSMKAMPLKAELVVNRLAK